MRAGNQARLGRRCTVPSTLALAAAVVLVAGCARGANPVAPPPTFTPVPTRAGVAPAAPAHPVVSQTCLRGLSSYRFDGSFSLQPSGATAPAGANGTQAIAGSIANLLRNVSFQGAAHAPDRYTGTVAFGGAQSLDVVRVGPTTYSRFGDSAWQEGDQLQELGGIARFDPETLCASLLATMDAGNQVPVHETVNGVPALRYELSGAQALAALAGDDAAASPRSVALTGHATVWAAESGGYPVRFEIDGSNDAGQVDLLVNVTDVNGKDIQISAPATATPQAGR